MPPILRLRRLHQATIARGIEPVFERTLNDLGVCRFEQLAQTTDEDLERIASKLETFPYRIVRDGWVQQAREFE